MNEEESCDETTQGSGSPGFMTPREERSNMPVIHYPDPMDVLLGRGRGIQQHPGNRQYQGKLKRRFYQCFFPLT